MYCYDRGLKKILLPFGGKNVVNASEEKHQNDEEGMFRCNKMRTPLCLVLLCGGGHGMVNEEFIFLSKHERIIDGS